jgi:hypothetical protein
MGRGRRPGGPEQVERLDGTPEAKRRLRVILETVAGDKSVAEACKELGIGEARFHELRAVALEGAVESLEARAAGRPRKEEATEPGRVEALEREIRELKLAVQAARVREELAIAMPHVLKPRPRPSQKKTPRSIITNPPDYFPKPLRLD